jgi:hypothetical protein
MIMESSVDSLLLRIAELLRMHGPTDWAEALDRLASEYQHSPESTKGIIRSLYGGMGSFNDIVLHDPNGDPLRAENDELAALRGQLWVRCQNWTA